MKKFKLIKEYPASDHEGIIVVQKTSGGMYEGYQYNYYAKHVENSPEYWEEVVEKDYEILSWTAKDCNSIVIKGSELPHTPCSLPAGYWRIHSVKRLSDGEIFTVGDKITGYHEDARSIQTIRICTYTGRIRLEQSGGYTDLMNATKVKQPISLTHDGKDIFVGNRIVWVNKDSLLHGTFTADYGSLFCSNQHAYFISAVDAQDYIEKNKVLFITADGVGIKQGDMIHGISKAGTTFVISNTVVRNNNRICEVFEAVFSTKAAAENYLVQKLHSLSIEDFWEFVSWGGSTIAKSKRLKRLVKERLNLK